MALFTWPAWVFLARTLDRLGKGIRTGARDAMLSEASTPQTRGTVFGFHRSMDTLGAVLGPALALIYLYCYPSQYQVLFGLAFLPGLFSIAFTLLLTDSPATLRTNRAPVSLLAFGQYWQKSPKPYRKLVSGLLLFALFNSSDLFLLLKVKEAGLTDTAVIGVYIFYNLVYAVSAYPVGRLADRIGLKPVFLARLFLFTLVYTGMAYTQSLYGFLGLFLLYGLYAAATEGVAKAWISTLVEKQDLATAIGTYAGFQSIGALLASWLAGWLWYGFGPATTFMVTSLAAGATLLYFLFGKRFQLLLSPKGHSPFSSGTNEQN